MLIYYKFSGSAKFYSPARVDCTYVYVYTRVDPKITVMLTLKLMYLVKLENYINPPSKYSLYVMICIDPHVFLRVSTYF